jgi:hypothetical protein
MEAKNLCGVNFDVFLVVNFKVGFEVEPKIKCESTVRLSNSSSSLHTPKLINKRTAAAASQHNAIFIDSAVASQRTKPPTKRSRCHKRTFKS